MQEQRMKNSKVNGQISLDQVQTNSSTFIKSILGDKRFISRAIGRGFTPGTKLVVVQNFRIGPVIVFLRDTQIALGRGEAHKIIVGA